MVCLVLAMLAWGAVAASPGISDEVLGVRLGTARDEVVLRYPGGACVDGLYTVRDVDSRFEKVEFGFTDAGTLSRVNRWYAPEFLAEVGEGDAITGLERLSAALQEAFGAPQPIYRSGRGSASDPFVISIIWNDARCFLAFRITAHETALDACLMLVSNEVGNGPRRSAADVGGTGKDGIVLGVRLGDSLADVRAKHPNGVFNDTCLVVRNPSEQHEQVSFSFTPAGRLVRVELVYAEAFLTKAGKGSPDAGIQELASSLADTHGPCDRMTNGGSGTAEDPAAYYCDWHPKGRRCALTLTVVQKPRPGAVLSIESPAPAERRWF
jgi:hypothetical protein